MSNIDLNFKKIEQEMSVNKITEDKKNFQSWTNGPRNFAEHTNNIEARSLYSDTQHTYKQKEFSNIGELKTEATKLGTKDFLVDSHISTANDIGYREMIKVHKNEMANVSNEDKPKLEKQHAFENSYCQYNMDKSQNLVSPQQEQSMKADVVKSYNDYNPTNTVKQENTIAPKVEQAQVKQESVSPKNEAYAQQCQKRMAMANIQSLRQKNGISLSISQ